MDENKFFSVRLTVDIGNAKYRPSVCYPITKLNSGAVATMIADGYATGYVNEVIFISGTAHDAGTIRNAEKTGTVLTPAVMAELQAAQTVASIEIGDTL
jgi:hypothetical protein